MSEQKVTKLVVEILCPHCSEKVLVSFRAFSPVVDWALKKEDLKTSKNKLRNEVENIKFDNKDTKKEVLKMIDNDELLISPEEVAPIVEQIIKDNVTEKDDIKKDTTQ